MQKKTRYITYPLLAVPAILTFAVMTVHVFPLSFSFETWLKASEKTSSSMDCWTSRQTAFSYPSDLLQKWTQAPDTLVTDQRELDVLRIDGATQNLSQFNVHNMTYQQLLLTCHSYLDTATVICKRKLRMGHLGDGGWEICDDPEVRPVPPCLIYSFGIGRDFSFDDEAARWYKCHVYSFDPTIEWNSYNRSHFVHFYNVGIADKTYTNSKGWKYSTFSDIRAMLGHKQSCINIVKIDVEGHEWDSLHQMTLSGQFSAVNQLLVEYHFNSLTHRYLLKFFLVLQGVELAGFEVFYTHKNEGCGYRVQGFPPIKSRCFEVHYRRRYKLCQSAI